MARIRTIKPDFFTSESIAALPYEARLTFIGLWTHADDEGRCVDNTKLIRAAIWPLDDRTLGDIEKDIEELVIGGMVERYSVDGRNYLHIPGMSKHQRVNRPTPSRLPAPTTGGEAMTAQELLTESSVSSQGTVTEDSPQERKGKEGKGRELETNPPHAGARDYVPNQNLSTGSDEKPAAMRGVPERVMCPRHVGGGNRIGDCAGCGTDFGDRKHFCDPSHWDDVDRRNSAGKRDYAAVQAWAVGQ